MDKSDVITGMLIDSDAISAASLASGGEHQALLRCPWREPLGPKLCKSSLPCHLRQARPATRCHSLPVSGVCSSELELVVNALVVVDSSMDRLSTWTHDWGLSEARLPLAVRQDSDPRSLLSPVAAVT